MKKKGINVDFGQQSIVNGHISYLWLTYMFLNTFSILWEAVTVFPILFCTED